MDMSSNHKKKKRRKVTLAQLVLNAIIIILIFLTFYPLAMALWSSLKTQTVYDLSKLYPTLPLHISNYKTAWTAVAKYMFNTVKVAVIGTIGMLSVASLASYAFARLKFPGRNLLFSVVMGLLMMPGTLNLMPLFDIYRKMGMIDSHWALIVPMIVGGPIGAIFLLNSFFKGIPEDIFEAARVDGANKFQCYYYFAVPLSTPILMTIAIQAFMGTWNDYLWPMITLHDTDKLTISAGLVLEFSNAYSSNMPVTFAGYAVAAIPLIILFVFANKQFIQGLVGSSIKF